jgi:hypothetical protein
MRSFLLILSISISSLWGQAAAQGSATYFGNQVLAVPGTVISYPTVSLGQTCFQATAGSTMTCALTGLTAGSALVVGIGTANAATLSTINDGGCSDSFTADANSGQTDASDGIVYLYAAGNIAGGNCMISVTFGASPSSAFVGAVEIKAALGSPRDTSIAANYSSSTTPTAGSITTGAASEMLIGAYVHTSGNRSEAATNSYTLLGTANGSFRGNMEYRLVSATGSYADGWSTLSTSGSAILAGYK